MLKLAFNPFRSLTIAGAVVGLGAGVLFPHFNPDALSPTLVTAIQVVGGFLGTIGIRNAVAKAAVDVLNAVINKPRSQP